MGNTTLLTFARCPSLYDMGFPEFLEMGTAMPTVGGAILFFFAKLA